MKNRNGDRGNRWIAKPNRGKGDYGNTEFIGTAIAYKSSWQAEACGTVDELNAFIGEAYSRSRDKKVKSILLEISRDLFILGTDIANTVMSEKILPRITTEHIHRLEDILIFYENKLPKIKHFIIPVGPLDVTILNQARAICRRAERQLVKMMRTNRADERSNPLILAYLNRLGDLLFVLSRTSLRKSRSPEIHWSRKDAFKKN